MSDNNDGIELEEPENVPEAKDSTTKAPKKKRSLLGKSKDSKLKKENEELKEEIGELKDKYLRLFAEFDNFKKRNIKERLELINSASQNTISSLLPILDDFERAKKSADDENTAEVFSDGVLMVYNRLNNVLGQQGLKAMETENQPFDPEYHAAISEIPTKDEALKGVIIDTIEKGYLLKDKIIRHAKVVVGK